MRNAYLVGALAWVFLVGLFGEASAIEAETRVVYAHHMHCYVFGAIEADDVRTSHPESVRELEGWPPIALESQWFSAERSGRAAAGAVSLQNDFADAERSGIDAFALLLAPGDLRNSRFKTALHLMGMVAEHQKVKLIPELWADSTSEDMRAFGAQVKSFMDAHPGAILKRGGRPMIAIASGYDNADDHKPTEIAARHLDDLLAELGGKDNLYIIGYGINFARDTAIESTASPIISASNAIAMWAPQDDLSGRQAIASLNYAQSVRKPYAFPVSPAFYQRRAGKTPWEYSVDYGAAHYIDGWMRAIESRSSFVNIQTWDDFSENTAINDSNTAGRSWLELTRYLASWFKSGEPPFVERELAFLFHPKQLASARLDQNDARVHSPRFRHRGGLADYIDVVTILKMPAEVTLTNGRGIWSFSAPAGLHEFTIYAPAQMLGSIVQGFESRPDGFVRSSAFREVKRVRAFDPSAPVVQLARNGRQLLRLESRIGYLNRGVFQDLSVIGDVGEFNNEPTINWR